MTGQSRRRSHSFAVRRHEQREIARQNDAAIVDVDDAKKRTLEHLRAARVAALEGRLVLVAGQTSSLIDLLERSR